MNIIIILLNNNKRYINLYIIFILNYGSIISGP